MMKSTRREGKAGFTLIELMAVITIIVILAALVIGGLGFVSEKQAKSKALVQIGQLSKALEEYNRDMGSYPLSSNIASVSKPNGSNNSAQCLYIPLFYEGWDYTRQTTPPGTWTKPGGSGTIPKAKEIYLADLDPMTSKVGWVDPVPWTGTMPASTPVKDPWGNQYCYRSAQPATGTASNSHTQNPDFDLWSMGKNGASQAGNTPAQIRHSDNRDDVKNF